MEHMPDLTEILSKDKPYNLMAVTPKACFDLDTHNEKYNIPDDFAIAEEVDFDVLFEEMEQKDVNPLFMIALSHIFRARSYWKTFLKRYKEQFQPTHCLYYGSESKFLIETLKEEFNERFHQI